MSIITLCGSGRFRLWYQTWEHVLTRSGHQVFGFLPVAPTKEARLAKIAASDTVVFLNVFAYLGDDSRRELADARRLEKRVISTESWPMGSGLAHKHKRHALACSLRVPKNFKSPTDTREGLSVWTLLPNDEKLKLALQKHVESFEKRMLAAAEPADNTHRPQ